jgi:hypothetical protein
MLSKIICNHKNKTDEPHLFTIKPVKTMKNDTVISESRFYITAILKANYLPNPEFKILDFKMRVALHNELYDLYSSPNIIRLIKSRRKLAGHVARTRGWKGACRVLVGRPDGKRPFGIPRHRW